MQKRLTVMHSLFIICLVFFAITAVTHAGQKGYDEEAIRRGDSYIDKLLENMFENSDEEYDPYVLEDSVVGFSRKVMFVNVTGEAKLHDGSVKGLSTLHRVKHCALIDEGEKLRVKADLGAGELEFNYKGSVKFMNFGPTITVHGTLSYIEVHMEFKVNSNTGKEGRLTKFVIDDMRDIKVRISGLGPLNWAINPILSGVTKLFKKFVRNFMEHKVEKHIREHIPNYQFPVEGGNTEVPDVSTLTEQPEETTTPEPETETPEPKTETPEPETEAPETTPQPETEAPQPETEAPEETPQPETEAPEETPQPETEAPEETPQPETEAPEETPQPETEAPEETPQPETEAPEETPQPETEAPEETPQPETEAPEETPQPETEAPEETPQPETEAPEETPEPQPETEAPEETPEPQPETEAPEETPEPQPETEAPEETPEPQPETEAPEETPEPEPEAEMPENLDAIEEISFLETPDISITDELDETVSDLDEREF